MGQVTTKRGYRHLKEISVEARLKITKPMQVNRIMNRLGIQHKQFKKLVDLKVLVYVDSEKQEAGSAPMRYVAVEETKLRTGRGAFSAQVTETPSCRESINKQTKRTS